MFRNFFFLCFCLFFLSACASSSINKDNKCLEIPKSGMCKAYFKKFYFNQSEKKCKQFIWGGCGGNIPFHTLEECKKTCE